MTELEQLIKNIRNEIPVLDSTIDYWLVRANSGEYYTDFNLNSYIGIGWNEITLKDIQESENDSNKLKDILKDKLTFSDDIEPSENKYGITAGQLLRFVNKIKKNDIVVVPSEGSERFLVGKVTGPLYELTQKQVEEYKDEESNHPRSDYAKRWNVHWLGWFNRSDADSALYKMIYSHTTLSNINEYKPFINRALFPCYIEDEKLFISYHVTEEKDIQGAYLGQFVYQYSMLTKLLFPEVRVDSKVNVQSEGIIELITHSINNGLIIAGILSGVIVITSGGKFKFMGLELEVPGLINTLQIYQANKIDNLKKAKALADELEVPMSELGIRIPRKLLSALEKQQNKIPIINSEVSDETKKESND
ncbi:TPA: hypothetical protein U1311_000868 [Streptococcus suis]|nr:hypothetical protein [Streptococcus suis]HEM5191844.1 hypothetical protein [Streptococcus suis]